MHKRVAILQSNYIPWKGYFDLINKVDEFILYDEVQYTKNDWRNRNRIKAVDGARWLSIPVWHKHKSHQRICDTEASQLDWGKKHWTSLLTNYNKAPFFKMYSDIFAPLYLDNPETRLSQINYQFITAINQILGIQTKISWSSDYLQAEGKTERLVSLCLASAATEYLSGPAAKDYLNEQLFTQANIKLSWMDYSGYPEYNQLYPPFNHHVSIVDLLFNTGPNAPLYMNSFGSRVTA